MSQSIGENYKEILNDAVHLLKKKKIIRFDNEIAEALGYARGSVSEILNPESGKPVTYSFMQKFKEYYGQYLDNFTFKPDKLELLAAEMEVLKREYLDVIAQLSGKTPQKIRAELRKKVKIHLNKKT